MLLTAVVKVWGKETGQYFLSTEILPREILMDSCGSLLGRSARTIKCTLGLLLCDGPWLSVPWAPSSALGPKVEDVIPVSSSSVQ